MEVIYGLIPGMIFIGLIMVGLIIWSVKTGQYDDLEGDAHRILMDDDDPRLPDEVRARETSEDAGTGGEDGEGDRGG